MAIGTGNAETDDEFLFDCFVDSGVLVPFLQPKSAQMVIAGRTGSGKTAIIRYIARNQDYAVELDPRDMSMNYVSNSDALRFLTAIGADLDLLFQVLWKHVICIEFIRLRWSIKDESKSFAVFQGIYDRFFGDARKRKSLEYLKRWQDKFWITMDENIKEITSSFEEKLNASFGAEIAKYKAGGQYDKRMSAGQKTEIIDRFRKIVNAEQLQELSGVIDILAEPDNVDSRRSFYILVDKLDENWVESSIRFKMIRALLESLKSLRRIQNLKVLVSLRNDVRERVLQETSDVTFQREKFDDYSLQLKWGKYDLFSLVERRINQLFKLRYSAGNIGFYDIFPSKVGAIDAFGWMLERTLMRPRDILLFVNECIAQADGSTEISVTGMRKAEVIYAQKRRDALLQEWFSAFPSLNKVLDLFAGLQKVSSTFEELLGSPVEDFALGLSAEQKLGHDPLFETCATFVQGKGVTELRVIAEAAAIAYRAGALGLKVRSGDPIIYSHINEPLIAATALGPDTRTRVHSMLHGAYRLQEGNKP